MSHVPGHCWSALSTAGLTAGPLRVYHWATGRRALSSISNQWSRPAPTCCSPTEQLPISSLQPTLQQRQLHIDSDNTFVYLQVNMRWDVPYRAYALYTPIHAYACTYQYTHRSYTYARTRVYTCIDHCIIGACMSVVEMLLRFSRKVFRAGLRSSRN